MFAASKVAGAVNAVANYIEDVFGTYLYTGNGTTQSISNGIDLAAKGGLVWIKGRNGTQYGNANHALQDSARGPTYTISSDLTNAQSNQTTGGVTSFDASGFSIGDYPLFNDSDYLYASWTFRKQAKFFDVVTWTGNGTNRTISHNLGSVPGCIMVKRTDTTGAWAVYHRSLANTEYMVLNTNAAKATGATYWNSTTPTSTVFSLGTANDVNANGGTYVAYLFAHDAGGFGLAGTDNAISCGSYTANGTTPVSVSLGYEPQWVLVKNVSGADNWYMQDVMRGSSYSANQFLFADLSNSESASGLYGIIPNATGFTDNLGFGAGDFIYIAIRRGPMKTPTSGTSVFSPVAYSGDGTANRVTTGIGFAPDLIWTKERNSGSGYDGNSFNDRLRGSQIWLITNSASAEADYVSSGLGWKFDSTTGSATLGSSDGGSNALNTSGSTYISVFFKRSTNVFDEVCYTGTGSNTTQTHNLGVTPELIIVKRRDTTGAWDTYSAALSNTEYLVVNTTAAKATGTDRWNSTTPTSTVFSLGTSATVNANGGTYVAYLFATCAGVSKVGSYTGTGTTLQIDCGFTGGARFVLIKRTDSTGDWYVWNSATGIVSGNDPYLLLNSTAAEVTNTDYVDTYSAGFEISSTAPAAINANGGSFIFLAIA